MIELLDVLLTVPCASPRTEPRRPSEPEAELLMGETWITHQSGVCQTSYSINGIDKEAAILKPAENNGADGDPKEWTALGGSCWVMTRGSRDPEDFTVANSRQIGFSCDDETAWELTETAPGRLRKAGDWVLLPLDPSSITGFLKGPETSVAEAVLWWATGATFPANSMIAWAWNQTINGELKFMASTRWEGQEAKGRGWKRKTFSEETSSNTLTEPA